ncbi:MAG: cbb3-type cytochrome c oxidase subunit II [Gammaproteobacteria bacterium]
MSLHTQHRMLIAIAAITFLFLSIFIAVLPAFEAERTPPLPGIQPPSPEIANGRALYLKEGCATCHTQFVRDLPVDAPYGRGSLAGDYALEVPPLLGTQRTGPDLSNVGSRQPSLIWNLIHLYNPRAVVSTSVMPGYPWLFEEKDAAEDDDTVVPVPDAFKPKGKVIVATQEALDMVSYLQSLQQVDVKP